MSSSYIFQYLRDSYSFLPTADKELFGEVWKSYEQVVGNLYNKSFEFDFNATTTRALAWNNERWCSYIFDSSTSVTRPAFYQSPLDLTGGINLMSRYLFNFYTDSFGPYEIDLRGANPIQTTSAEISSKINAVVGFNFVSVLSTGELYFATLTTGPTAFIKFVPASVPANDASELIVGILPSDLPKQFPQFPYVYNIQDQYIVSIPTMQNSIRDENIEVILTEGTDYSIESGNKAITFTSPPRAKMWAKNNLINRETPYNNFGYLLDFYDKNSDHYLETLKGIWYAFWVGPRPNNIKRAMYLLFGLPVAKQSGTVKNVTKGYLMFQEDLVIPGDGLGPLVQLDIPLAESATVAVGQQMLAGNPYTDNIATIVPTNGTVVSINKAIVSFQQDSDFGQFEAGALVNNLIPFGLHPVVKINDRLQRFDPLTDGILVIDHVNYPGYFALEVGREGLKGYLTESASTGTAVDTDETKALTTAELSTFLVQISSEAFLSKTINIANVKNFLFGIRPLSKTFIFQLLVSVDDKIQTEESLAIDINIDVTPNVDYNPWMEADPSVLNAGEITLNEGLLMDSELFIDNEITEIDVHHNASTIPVLVDAFTF
jgi:hypothetical protein